MAERSKATDLKSVVGQPTGGSNPSPSAGPTWMRMQHPFGCIRPFFNSVMENVSAIEFNA